MKNTDLLLDDLLGKAPPKTISLDISKLHPFEGHPYKVLDDEDMEALVIYSRIANTSVNTSMAMSLPRMAFRRS